MIDVHPTHHGTFTRRDFFIHLFIVVLGILIAIGLEQSVEYIHHRHQLAEARRQLDTEYKINLAVYRTQRAEVDRFVPIVQRDLGILMYLRTHPGASPSKWPGEFSWYNFNPSYYDSTWKSLQGTEILALMPPSEVQRNTALYSLLTRINDNLAESATSLRRARSYGIRRQDPASMTPAEFDDAIQSVTVALNSLAGVVNAQIILHAQFRDFAPAPNYSEQFDIMGLQSPAQDRAAGGKLSRQLSDEIARIQAESDKTK